MLWSNYRLQHVVSIVKHIFYQKLPLDIICFRPACPFSPLDLPLDPLVDIQIFVFQIDQLQQWNSWFDAMLYNRMSSNLTTLQYELMKLLSSVTNQGTSAEAMKNAAGTVTPTSVRAAATIITMLPIICIYPFLQKYFVAGLTLGGVKE